MCVHFFSLCRAYTYYQLLKDGWGTIFQRHKPDGAAFGFRNRISGFSLPCTIPFFLAIAPALWGVLLGGGSSL